MKPWRLFLAFMLVSMGAFSVYINMMTTPQEIWYTYSLGAAIIIALQILLPKQLTFVTWVSAIIVGAVLVRENFLDSPSYPWYLYTIGGLVLWAVAVTFRKHLANLGIACLVSLTVCLYYFSLHSYFGHENPWYGFIIFTMSWWPLSIIGHRTSSLFFSVIGFGSLSVFFLFVNIAYSPSVIWAIYPIFGAAWWPLTAYFYSHRRHLSR
ncbi:hypothetical protein SAMN05421663_106192 [Terribacillus halophilus]|uniref:Uncharacterized protein n=1 Tax=Terribacillus halophilus TaxID=361279 RepID=A0A1G6RUA1_9BACI|nr:hypothetical protein [Terribacillus halophilus]SDD07964.1 hypothetical protein SAMN05421663_106192 [Terribacillus halophilus]